MAAALGDSRRTKSRKGHDHMNIRKIAVVVSFAAGSALASAPLAVADDLTSTVESEISSLNLLFQIEADLAGVSSSDYAPDASGFDVIDKGDVATVTPSTAPFSTLDNELFGVNPGTLITADPGSVNLFNGALVEFDDASNATLYSLLNDSNLIPAADLFGPQPTIDVALATGSDAGAFTTFFDAGINDLDGFFGLAPSF